ncbi:MAG: 50S ribosomal protein L3 [Candidatus Saganbacteria bacterium]|nr:50S ribosomal protein L3 [Candidatus Saganbacteria bacterium]
MRQGLIGRKIGMTQVYDQNGCVVPVTVLEVGPCVVTQLKEEKKDGYCAIQLGFGERKKMGKTFAGHFKGISPYPKYLKEFRLDKVEGISRGQVIRADIFSAGEVVVISGTSIGKGTAGTIKRWNFSRGDMGHGSKSHRLPGSIGGGTTPGRVFKGQKMAGRMGNEKVTQKNILVVDVDVKKNVILVKGAVPGSEKGIISIFKTGKKVSNFKPIVSANAKEEKAVGQNDVQEKDKEKVEAKG